MKTVAFTHWLLFLLSISTSLQQFSSAFFLPHTTTITRASCCCHRRSSLKSSASSEENTNNSDDDNRRDSSSSFNMATLQSRITEVSSNENLLPLILLDSMLPRQVLTLSVADPVVLKLVRTLLAKESPYLGMMGLAKLKTGETVHMKNGVEVEIVKTRAIQEEGKTMVELELKAGRRIRILDSDGAIKNAEEGGWTEARVEFLSSKEEEEAEIALNANDDPLSVARAIMKGRDITDLVPQWIELARKNERQPNQIDTLLQDLGDIPTRFEPSERAFWIGALINPLPAMGVALEIRPGLLTAKTSEERIDIALEGIQRSIAHMDGSARLF